jgi:hypothetical protein
MAWVKSMIAWLEWQPEPAKSVEWVFDPGFENYQYNGHHDRETEKRMQPPAVDLVAALTLLLGSSGM